MIILAAVAALPLFLLAVYHAEEQRRASFEQARQDALLMARTQAALQAAVLNQTRHLLSGLAAGLVFDASPAGKDCRLPLKRIVEANPFHFNASVADLEGNVHCSVRPLAKAVNIADRNYFRKALEQKTFAVSELITGRTSGAQLIVSAQPVVDEGGAIRAVLIASVDAIRLAQSFQTAPTWNDTVVMLLDGEGRIVARFPDVPEFRGKTLPGYAQHKQAMTETSGGFFDYVGLNGVSRVAAYAALPNAREWPLHVVVGIPRTEVESAPRAALLRDLATTALVLAIALGISFVGAQRLIVAPLRQLGAAAGRYDRGDLSARSGLDHRAGEIGALASTFDQLAAHTERSRRALKALSAGNRTLLREKDEPRLMAAMCRVAVEHAGYRLALVNYTQHDERKSVRTVARSGYDEGFVDALDLTWADTERGRGSVGIAIRTAKTCVVRSLASDPRFSPWREAARARGFGSIASFPLRVDGEVIGTFSIIAAEEDAFDAGELELLDEMAADLSFGIEVLRSNARRVAAEEAARFATTHDRLTGLPGRIPFLRALEQVIPRASQSGEALGVIVVNLPNLQDLHDSLGYEPVNAAVMESAFRLKSAMSPATQLARLATDDFVMLLPQADAAKLAALAQRLQALFSAPIDVSEVPIDVRIGVGAALFPEHGTDPDILIRRAGIAAREASRRELAFFVYHGRSERENPERLTLAAELRQAVEQRQLLLHLQPKVELAWGGVRGAEALVRWAHPAKGMIPPVQFVPIAEQTGLIRPMTSLVIELAMQQLHAWRERPLQLPIAVNLSPRNLHDPGLVEQIERRLGDCNLPAALLEFEITESALAEDPDKAREVLGRLRALGCKLYIDDFGTGYSSLSYLVSLPVHAVKIDRSFVRQMSKSREAHAVVASIVLMAHELGLQTVAEGVETKEDAEMLLRLGCDEAQGYYFAKPLPAEQFNPGS